MESIPFHLDENPSLPPLARRYLSHAIADGTPLATSVQLQMVGVIKLGKWRPFTARQVIRIGHGFVWEAKVPVGFTFISGFDQIVDGHGEMNWKLHGLLKVMGFTGADVSRAAEGRLACELTLLPSALCDPNYHWTETGEQVTVRMKGYSVESKLAMNLEQSGAVESVCLDRWGNADGGDFKMMPFGGTMESEKTFGGYTIPTRIRVGWNFGNDKFEKGEFFRAEITNAEFH
jgi:hypothetical protein